MSKLETLTDKLARGALTRRHFIEGASALGITTAAAVSLSARIAAAAPKKGGVVRFGMGHGSTTDSTDPRRYENEFTNILFHAVHARMTEITAGGGLAGEVAESWEASDDAATWTFKLRKEIEFHNGKTVSADDVVASINHHRGEGTGSGAAAIVEPIAELRADGPDTVIFKLNSGNADFPFLLSDYHLAILPTADDKPDISGVGCGSYVLDTFDPGVRATTKRFANHWDNRRGYFDGADVLSIPDTIEREEALVSGSVDIIDRVATETARQLEENPAIELMVTAGTQHFSFPMRTDTSPFDNNDLRLAIKYAVDRERFLQTVQNGFGEVANDSPITPANRFYNADLEPKSLDIDKARFHLKKAGLSEVRLDLSVSDAAFSGAVESAVEMKAVAARAGILINVVREPFDGYWSDVWLKKPWCACYWNGRPTEDFMFSTAYKSGVPWNDTKWSHERFDKLLLQARAEFDVDRRREIYHEMQRIVSYEGGVVIPCFASYVSGVSTKVGRPKKVATNWNLDGSRAMERWWFV